MLLVWISGKSMRVFSGSQSYFSTNKALVEFLFVSPGYLWWQGQHVGHSRSWSRLSFCHLEYPVSEVQSCSGHRLSPNSHCCLCQARRSERKTRVSWASSTGGKPRNYTQGEGKGEGSASWQEIQIDLSCFFSFPLLSVSFPLWSSIWPTHD